MLASSLVFVISKSFNLVAFSNSSLFFSYMYFISASSVIYFALAFNSDNYTSDLPSISFYYYLALASAFACPELLMDSHSASREYKSFFFSSALASS